MVRVLADLAIFALMVSYLVRAQRHLPPRTRHRLWVFLGLYMVWVAAVTVFFVVAGEHHLFPLWAMLPLLFVLLVGPLAAAWQPRGPHAPSLGCIFRDWLVSHTHHRR